MKTNPKLKGGQGRSPRDLCQEGEVMLYLSIAAMALLGLAILREVIA